MRLDVKQLASDLFSYEKLDNGIREVLVERMLESAINIINVGMTKSGCLDEFEFLTQTMESEYGVLAPDNVILDYVKIISTNVGKLGWDSRLKLKITFTKIHKRLNLAKIQMDLDKTFEVFLDQNDLIAPKQDKQEHITDLVTGEPNLSEINKLMSKLEREHEQKAKHQVFLNRVKVVAVRDQRSR